MHNAEKQVNQESLNEIFNDITHFLSKMRRIFVFTLYENGELSQGELARIAGTTVTSAANIMMKFSEYQYRLIDMNSRGKYRYYRLTSLAVQYVEYINSQQEKEAEEQIIHHSELMLLQRAKNSLNEFKRIYDDDWDVFLDDCLISYIECKEMEETEENLIQGMLHSLAIMDLDECENSMDKFLEIIEVPILSKRIEKFMDTFATIRPILQLLKNEKNVYYVNELFLAIISEDVSEVLAYAKRLGVQQQCEKLQETIGGLKNKLYGKDKEEIFVFIKRFFPGQQQLCFTLADKIYNI